MPGRQRVKSLKPGNLKSVLITSLRWKEGDFSFYEKLPAEERWEFFYL
jgi:hypothetical protein